VSNFTSTVLKLSVSFQDPAFGLLQSKKMEVIKFFVWSNSLNRA
jgi:hypothetical protein